MTSTTLAAIGLALQVQGLALLMIAISSVGSLFSYFGFVRRPSVDQGYWSAVGVICTASVVVLLGAFLLNLAPAGTWTGVLRLPGFLAWFVCLSAFFLWTDSTRMFQAVPCLALFGIMCVYDSFGGVVACFFVFTLILAITFSRAHTRKMLQIAFESGFSRIDEGTSLRPEQLQQDSMVNAMRRGPWKGMVGIQTPVILVLVAIAISIVFALPFQSSTKGIAGQVQVAVPHQFHRMESSNSNSQSNSDYQPIAQGPVNLSNKVVGIASGIKTDYLEQEEYSVYSGTGWKQNEAEFGYSVIPSSDPTLKENQQSMSLRDGSINSISKPAFTSFSITLFDETIAFAPLPKLVYKLSKPVNYAIMGEGKVPTKVGPQTSLQFQGNSIASAIQPGSTKDPDNVVGVPDLEGISTTQRVRDLAAQITKGLPNDWEKAQAIQRAIAARCVYDANTPAYPPGQDDVDYFLFNAKRGYCEMFASAMAVMARCVGIQAKYATGYLLDPNDVSDGNLRIRDNDSHAWAILNFQHVGWIVFDATEGAQDVSKTSGDSNRFFLLAFALGAVLVLVLVGILSKVLADRSTTKKLLREKYRAQILSISVYEEFCHRVKKRSQLEMSSHWTVQEYVQRAASMCGEDADAVRRIGREFESLFYSEGGMTEVRANDIRSQVYDLRIEPQK